LGKALLCFSVQLKITAKENRGNRKVSITVDSEDEFAGEYEPSSFKTKVGMLFGWLKEQGVSTVPQILMEVRKDYGFPIFYFFLPSPHFDLLFLHICSYG
jgi:hypothetical protein